MKDSNRDLGISSAQFGGWKQDPLTEQILQGLEHQRQQEIQLVLSGAVLNEPDPLKALSHSLGVIKGLNYILGAEIGESPVEDDPVDESIDDE